MKMLLEKKNKQTKRPQTEKFDNDLHLSPANWICSFEQIVMNC